MTDILSVKVEGGGTYEKKNLLTYRPTLEKSEPSYANYFHQVKKNRTCMYVSSIDEV